MAVVPAWDLERFLRPVAYRVDFCWVVAAGCCATDGWSVDGSGSSTGGFSWLVVVGGVRDTAGHVWYRAGRPAAGGAAVVRCGRGRGGRLRRGRDGAAHPRARPGAPVGRRVGERRGA